MTRSSGFGPDRTGQLSAKAPATPPLLRLDFHPKYIHTILNGVKTATCRLNPLSPHDTDSASDTNAIIDAATTNGSVRVTATSNGINIAKIDIGSIDHSRTIATVTEELAELEDFDSASELRTAILSHYPHANDAEQLVVFHFALICTVDR